MSLNISLLSSSAPSIPTANLIPTKASALNDCILAIKNIIKRTRLEIEHTNPLLEKIHCSIGKALPKETLVTNCGHLYDKKNILSWLATTNSDCPVCRRPLTHLNPAKAIDDLVETFLQEDPIVTCSSFEKLDQPLVDAYLKIANIHISKNNYSSALDVYKSILRYTKFSEIYAEVPKLYDKLEEKEKGSLSRLNLSLYQLEEGKIEQAIATLWKCTPLSEVVPPLAGLQLHFDPSFENKMWAINALKDQNIQNTVFINKQILAQYPYQFNAYAQILPLLSIKERKEYLLQAIRLANQKGSNPTISYFQSIADYKPLPNSITKEDWAKPPDFREYYPLELKEFLEGDCTIWPGKKRRETHIVAPLFPFANLPDLRDKTVFHRSLDILSALSVDTQAKGVIDPNEELKIFWARFEEINLVTPVVKFGVLTKTVIPGTENIPYEEQLKLLPQGYEIPSALNAATAILFEKNASGITHYASTVFWTKDIVESKRIAVGDFMPSYLYVGRLNSPFLENLGIAGWQTF